MKDYMNPLTKFFCNNQQDLELLEKWKNHFDQIGVRWKEKRIDVRPHKDEVFIHIRMQEGTDFVILLNLIKRAYQKTQ